MDIGKARTRSVVVVDTVKDASSKRYREGSLVEALAPFWLYTIVLSCLFGLAV